MLNPVMLTTGTGLNDGPLGIAETGTPDVSVIIVSFNTSALLQECLQTLYEGLHPGSAEVFVVDNGSRDDSVAMVRQNFPDVRLVEAKVNLGFAGANNIALSLSRGRYVVLLNSDAFLTSGALRTAVQRMDGNPDAGAAGFRLIGRDGVDQPSARKFPALLGDFLTLTGMAHHWGRWRGVGGVSGADVPRDADWITGTFLIVSQRALQDVGRLDGRFFLYYEEVDWCRRIRDAGWRICYWPDVTVLHLGGESSKTLTHLQFTQSGSLQL
ncbi:MAG: glycosyltransferase family 2 protein, partial [Bryobacteraceae bacterium]|nr:glycosyltransferase family 2 protein [Bryobacteraceae bacterium]